MLTHLQRTAPQLAKIPRGTPTCKSWHIERHHVVRTVLGAFGRDGGARLVGLVGRSGAGKTTATSEIVRNTEVRETFSDGMVWLPVNKSAKDRLHSLMLQLARVVHVDIAHSMGDPPAASDDCVAYVNKLLGRGRSGRGLKCLVVADNVWEEEVVSKLLETDMWVLLSTRDKRLVTGAVGEAVGVDELSDADAESMLRKAAELPPEARLPDDAIDLIDLCGHVAMDLAFVGRWSMVRGRQDRTAWSEAAGRIRQEMGKVRAGCGTYAAGDARMRRRKAILQAGFEDLGSGSDDERVQRLYLSLGVLPDDYAFTKKNAATLLYDKAPSADDEASAGGVLDTLERWAVLRSEEGFYRMHDAHAGFARDNLEDRGDVRKRALRGWLKCIGSLEAVRSIDRYVLKRLWLAAECVGGEGWAKLRPYVKALDGMSESHPSLRETIEAVATFQEAQQDWKGASTTWCRLLQAEKRDLGDHHPYVLNTYRSISNCSKRLGNTTEAAEWLEKVRIALPLTLAKIQEQLDAGRVKGLDGAAGLLSLASTMSILSPGDRGRAEMMLRRSLEMQETELGPQDMQLCYNLYARTLHKLGVGVRQARRFGEAEELLKRCLSVVEAKLGPQDAQAAATLHELGIVVKEAGRLDEAEELMRRCLAIQEAKLGGDNAHVAVTLNRLAARVREGGRLNEAEVLLRRCLAITEANLGPEDLGVASILCELCGCVQTVGRLDEAQTLLRRCLAIQEAKLGPEHVTVASTLFWLGECIQTAGRLEEAEKLLRRCLDIREVKLVPEDSAVASVLYALGVCARQGGLFAEAENLLKGCLAIEEAELGPEDVRIACTLDVLGFWALEEGRLDQAEQLLRRCLAIRAAKLGPTSVPVASTLFRLGSWAVEAGRLNEAEDLLRRSLAVAEASTAPEKKGTASTLYWLGTCMRAAGKVNEAEEMLRRCLAIEE
ncbi:unnamed protein product, partial [Hapterophycus canaliculatus]